MWERTFPPLARPYCPSRCRLASLPPPCILPADASASLPHQPAGPSEPLPDAVWTTTGIRGSRLTTVCDSALRRRPARDAENLPICQRKLLIIENSCLPPSVSVKLARSSMAATIIACLAGLAIATAAICPMLLRAVRAYCAQRGTECPPSSRAGSARRRRRAELTAPSPRRLSGSGHGERFRMAGLQFMHDPPAYRASYR